MIYYHTHDLLLLTGLPTDFLSCLLHFRMEFLKVVMDTSDFSPFYWITTKEWTEISADYSCLFHGLFLFMTNKLEMKTVWSKMILFYPTLYYFAIPSQEGLNSFSLSTGNLEIPPSWTGPNCCYYYTCF